MTESFASDTPQRTAEKMEWVLVVAFDCDRLSATPLRASLLGIVGVDVGRGEERALTVADGRLRIDLPDRWTSRLHARLSREPDGWIVEDSDSKNGTRVNGARVARARLVEGDVLEIGGTFFVLTRGALGDGQATRAGELSTVSPAFERELSLLPRISRSNVAVLVRGESGTGKEVAARSVHALSGRRGPLVPVNCGAIPAALLEGELFGSRRGAFSGAEDRVGLVRSAEHGTLFLDEVVELPLTSQAALLRFLQDGEITPLGADKRIIVDVRVIAATNKPVEDLVAAGGFRHDLLARLRGYVVELPPLRARIADLGLLVGELLARLEPNGPERRLSRSAARALFLHGWPLNVRELEQALRAALATTTGPEIGLEDLRLEQAAERPAPGADESRDHIAALLAKHAGNTSAVARELATSRTQVARLLTRHRLVANDYKRR